ncbi:hypothetical protein H5410_047435 [Solanum commersonii]|uniref:Uncharacterized protein n=1 Tax=Solanum commersonii TaxID=4109 RepID=A0A9J5XF42_SOLCO|nr:hypothetical protein H5410_047435 [Solanum commersonii]
MEKTAFFWGQIERTNELYDHAPAFSRLDCVNKHVREEYIKHWVLTLGTGESWRNTKSSPRDLCMLEVCIVEYNWWYPLAGFRQILKAEESYIWKDIQPDIISSFRFLSFCIFPFNVTCNEKPLINQMEKFGRISKKQ